TGRGAHDLHGRPRVRDARRGRAARGPAPVAPARGGARVVRRAVGFAVIVVLCVGGALAYLWHARGRTAPAAAPARTAAADGDAVVADGVLVYRVSAGGADDGALAVAPLEDPGAARL